MTPPRRNCEQVRPKRALVSLTLLLSGYSDLLINGTLARPSLLFGF